MCGDFNASVRQGNATPAADGPMWPKPERADRSRYATAGLVLNRRFSGLVT
jgi:hypothetical protein